MATATREIPAEVPTVLILDDEEAKTLHRILCRVGGCPDTSRRKYADSIRHALEEVDMRDGAAWADNDSSGSISFRSGDYI